MNFRTEIKIEKSHYGISHFDNIALCGSCFSENIGDRLQHAGFNVLHNPMGILYNPSSMAIALHQLIGNSPFEEDKLLLHNGLWHTFSHHGKYSHSNKETCLETINNDLHKGHAFLKKTTLLMVTFGTSWVYQLASSGSVVANCHKYPERKFLRRRLSVEEIVAQWNSLLSKLKELNSNIRVVFTVSPVRHWKDGANGNQLSKAILQLAVEELCTQNKECHYFPAYELVIDDLRDYRFFKEDMLHPNSVAVDYVWDKFKSAYFTPNTITTVSKINKVKQAFAHRPMRPDADAFFDFATKQLAIIADLETNNSNIFLHEEKQYFNAILNTKND